MAENKKISELTRVSSLTGAEIVPFAKDGSNGAVTTAKLKEYAQPDLSAITTALGGKVDKVTGKELSTNDYTDADKAKLTALPTNTQLTEKIDEAKLALFIDQWNAACGSYGKYDPANAPDAQHPFYLNTLWLTYEEAINSLIFIENTPGQYCFYNNNKIRTNISGANASSWVGNPMDYAFFQCSKLEVANIIGFSDNISSARRMFSRCVKLRKVIGEINFLQGQIDTYEFAHDCVALEDIQITKLRFDLNLADCPLLSLASLQFMVANAANTTPITITVHPEVYAKLTATEHSAQARSNLALNSDVPVTSANYPMKQYPLNTVVKTGDALTITVWGTPSEGSYLYAVIENCRVDGNLVEISPGVWQKTFVLKDEKATAPHLNIYNNPNNRLEGHIDKVKICYGLDPSPQWSAPVEMPTAPEAIEAIGWERVMLMAAAKNISFATV